VGCLQGMGEACVALDYPIVSGNASLYNETMGKGILPTPAIGGVGLLQNVTNHRTIAFKAEGESIIVIGETKGHLGTSIYSKAVCGCHGEVSPPKVDLAQERAAGELLLDNNELITASHDISDGGLVIAIAEMAMASNLGATLLEPDTKLPLHAWLFGEDQGRYIVCTDKPKIFLKKAEQAGVAAVEIGQVKGSSLQLGSTINLPIADLKTAHENWMPKFMGDNK
jgi:phosphoribosylformylglycinamidine (FGAM) synthase-like enzyme